MVGVCIGVLWSWRMLSRVPSHAMDEAWRSLSARSNLIDIGSLPLEVLVPRVI